MNIFLISAFLFAALEVLALQRNQPRLEYVAKPAVLVALFLWLWTSVGLQGALLWFGLGILFSLAGGILLTFSLDRFFLAGLVTFLFAHVAYVIGFNTPLPELSGWSLVLAVIIGVNGVRVMRRILAPPAAQGQSQLRVPIVLYGVVISIMLLSALMKLTDLSWNAVAALLVSLGAFLFYLSDIILAWMKFIAPVRHGPMYNMLSYHLGQIALIAGVVLQFK
ncbi:MAG TPA: lysoplasmalogenase [Anaerolineales bacterium]|nr:lysoplasmalogenase [Anaerolineales bacterium]